MVFDKEIHKQIALQLIETANIPGKLIDQVYDFKLAVLKSTVLEEKPKNPGGPGLPQ